ncbi:MULTISPECIES: (d)CMP kinase [Enterococcus]|uniref:Cytidylate kinase n=1 Tax=Enterococcus sulfureus ATCC 49903 TaxID=1140003 RepID=S0L3S0_9ENTE|nr:(d)CMP kinase [Enterococcus sulfureus]EOT47995.1 cytidylate kinase [Enterococcus sulfureus ATCC 49903]EOT84149.1 cytidylate kinase [Enterococcus sulfureus ATCC 49903]
MKKIKVAIDGPASSGKSTVAKRLAKQFGFIYTDTGAMYRAVTYLALTYHVPFSDEQALVELLHQHPIEFKQTQTEQQVFVDQKNITDAIRQPDVTNNVSEVATHQGVREALVKQQQLIAENGQVIMDGRDIGTAVLPDAQVKIFLVASVTERAQRRYAENQTKGILTDLDTLTKEIQQRDHIDSTREISPLKQAEDAILVDTTGKSIDQVVQIIAEYIQQAL